MSSTIVHLTFELLNNIKFFHWKTKKYAQHIATDKLHTSLSLLLDKLMEVYLGRNLIETDISDVQIYDYDIEDFKEYLVKVMKRLKLDPIFMGNRSDLVNIRDEILAEIEQTLYLLNLE